MRRLTREGIHKILERAAPAMDPTIALEIANRIIDELEKERANGEPIFAMVSCTKDGRPSLNSMDELNVADLGWFESIPDPVKALMGKMEVGEIAILQGEFHLFEEEWNTPQLIKRVL